MLTYTELRDALPIDRIERHGWRTYSQNDEDGIIAEILRRIGAPKRTFCEIAPGNGLVCNTRLLLEQGWTGAWVEANARTVERLSRKAWSQEIAEGRLQYLAAMATIGNVDELALLAGPDLDVLSIDVDGVDWYLWDALRSVRPRLVVIEYNAKDPPPIVWRVEYADCFTWNKGTSYFGASLSALARLGRDKGYSLVGCNLTGVNAFFVRNDLLGDRFTGPFTAEWLYHPLRLGLMTPPLKNINRGPTRR